MNCIAAIAKNYGIGAGNRLLFSLPGDMKYFKSLTLGKTVIMGRRTLESFPHGRPLPKRTNIVLTRNADYANADVTVCKSRDEALDATRNLAPDDVWVIGGAAIYSLFINDCSRAYLTEVDSDAPKADSFFPELRKEDGWVLESRSQPHMENGLTYTFGVYRNTRLT